MVTALSLPAGAVVAAQTPAKAVTGVIRSLGGIQAEVTIQESGKDEITITDHPIESGASISDHAYKNPVTLTVQLGWSNGDKRAGGDVGYIKTVYDQLRSLQAKRQPIEVITGKRTYKNMMIRGISETTNSLTENALIVTIDLKEVILVETKNVKVVPASSQADPKVTNGISDRGLQQAKPSGQAVP